MKHLQTFNERNLVNKVLFKDESIILKVINSLKTKCPPKNIKVIHKPIKPVKKFQVDHVLQKFQTITFFTTTPTKEDFKITNVKVVLYCEDYLLRTNLVISVFVDGKELECSKKSKEELYNILNKYI